MQRQLLAALFSLTCVLTTSGQKIEARWYGLQALESSKTDVEKRLGQPKRVDDNGYYHYESREAFAEVSYSTEPCQSDKHNRGIYKVPAWTILELGIQPRPSPPIGGVDFDLQYYIKDESGGFTKFYSYINDPLGIKLGFVQRPDLNDDFLGIITYFGTADQRAKLKCEVPS